MRAYEFLVRDNMRTRDFLPENRSYLDDYQQQWQQFQPDGEEQREGMVLRWQQVRPNRILLQALSGDGSRELGSVQFHRYDPTSPKWTGEALHVDQRYRRQGVATAMYDWFKQKFGPIRPSDAQTRDGESFWQRKKVWEQGVAEEQNQIKLGPQLFVNRQTTMEGIKPRASAWTSTAQKTSQGYTSEWVEWCKDNMRQWISDTGVLYDVAPGARILLLRNDLDLIRVAKKYGLKIKDSMDLFEKMDWDVLRKDYNAIHHIPQGRDYFMSAWDVESTAWFDKKFLTNPRKVKINTSDTITENGGYVPVNSKEARDPRFKMALSVDIKPGEIKRQAAKMGMTTDAAGRPPLLRK